MKKQFALIAVCALVLFACHKEESKTPASVNAGGAQNAQQQQYTAAQINQYIHDVLEQKNVFEWKDANDNMVWSALQLTDNILSVGYQPFGATNVDAVISTININDDAWKNAKQQVLQIIFNEESKLNKTLRITDLEVWKEKKLPVIDVYVNNKNTISVLRKSKLIRYAEPMAYDPLSFEPDRQNLSGIGGSGCGGYNGDNSLTEGYNYSVTTPNAKVSWNYSYMGIQNAWVKSTGAGIKVMVIDTGVSPDQENLGSAFNQGQSSGRTLQKIFTMTGAVNADDGCGHGTAMCGELAAPRATDGNSCGVAYNCNLVACRAAEDVYIDASKEVKGVSDAYTTAADDPTIKITSMSMGRITSSSQISDAIRYASGKGKLMFCAGGTSFSWTSWFFGVIFPASMAEVQAITGIKDKSDLAACTDCHKGSQIDFVIVMEKTGTDVHAITTAMSGDQPTTVGGSSVATSTAAGIAALVWSKFPSFTREDVINKLTITAGSYPNKTKNYGWGILNADAATN